MAWVMKSLAVRRCKNTALLAVTIGVVFFIDRLETVALGNANFFTGWVLLTGILLLTAFNLRKKLPFLNLVRANIWLQLHIYTGLLTVGVFLMHLEFRFPNGVIEVLLAIIFILVAGSGIFGIWISRRLPPKLSLKGEQILFERIPAFRAKLRKEIEELILGAVTDTSSTPLADFYSQDLFSFLSGPRNFWFHVFDSNRPYHQLRLKMQGLDRYLNEKEKEIMTEIGHRLLIKDNLDYQYAGQVLLKRWLFVHIPLTYSLLVFAVFHVVVIYAFSGGI